MIFDDRRDPVQIKSGCLYGQLNMIKSAFCPNVVVSYKRNSVISNAEHVVNESLL